MISISYSQLKMVDKEDQSKIYSKRIRAGKRTYFFDVRATRSNDYYLTVTESRRYLKDGEFSYEKSKLFIYKEDFDKVAEALNETLNYIKAELMPDVDFQQFKDSNSIEDEAIKTDQYRNNDSFKWD